MLIHGMAKTRFWTIYQGIRQRCSNKSGKNAKWYTGIKCQWKTFEDFKEDMYDSYLLHVAEHGEGDTTIDRINSRGDYSKDNCRWATNAEQSRNTSQNHWISFRGRTQCLSDWATELGLKKTTLTMRLQRNWPVDKALTLPKGARY